MFNIKGRKTKKREQNCFLISDQQAKGFFLGIMDFICTEEQIWKYVDKQNRSFQPDTKLPLKKKI